MRFSSLRLRSKTRETAVQLIPFIDANCHMSLQENTQDQFIVANGALSPYRFPVALVSDLSKRKKKSVHRDRRAAPPEIVTGSVRHCMPCYYRALHFNCHLGLAMLHWGLLHKMLRLNVAKNPTLSRNNAALCSLEV